MVSVSAIIVGDYERTEVEIDTKERSTRVALGEFAEAERESGSDGEMLAWSRISGKKWHYYALGVA